MPFYLRPVALLALRSRYGHWRRVGNAYLPASARPGIMVRPLPSRPVTRSKQ